MQQEENCYVFIDNSNLFIESQKFNAKRLKLYCETDMRCRLDFGKLVDALVGERNGKEAHLFGSEPPPNDHLWKKLRVKISKYTNIKKMPKIAKKK